MQPSSSSYSIRKTDTLALLRKPPYAPITSKQPMNSRDFLCDTIVVTEEETAFYIYVLQESNSFQIEKNYKDVSPDKIHEFKNVIGAHGVWSVLKNRLSSLLSIVEASTTDYILSHIMRDTKCTTFKPFKSYGAYIDEISLSSLTKLIHNEIHFHDLVRYVDTAAQRVILAEHKQTLDKVKVDIAKIRTRAQISKQTAADETEYVALMKRKSKCEKEIDFLTEQLDFVDKVFGQSGEIIDHEFRFVF